MITARRVVLIHTNYDVETETTSKWALEARHSLTLCDHLHTDQVVSARLRTALQKLDQGGIIAFYGHGTTRELLGSNDTPIVGTTGSCVLPLELAKMRVYAVACFAGVHLGPALGNAQCEFIGYSERFIFAPGFEESFSEVVNNALIEWSRGAHVQDVFERLQRAWEELADTLTTDPPREPRLLSFKAVAAGFALMNANCLTHFTTP